MLSIGIMVWNEEDSIRAPLEALFRQSIFEQLCIRHELCEIVVVAHACTDGTAVVARRVFETMQREHTWTDGFTARVIEIPESGKPAAWNRFVHEFSAVEARFICSMDPQIEFAHRDALYNLTAILERKPHVSASTGRACPRLTFKGGKPLREKMGLAIESMTAGGDDAPAGQLCCLRASVARSLFIPRDLGPAGDGFIRRMVCTEFLTRDPAPGRLVIARDATYILMTPASPDGVLEQWKRQMMGEAAVHVLTEHVRTLGWDERINLADTIRRMETGDPDWLKKRVAVHLARRPFCWQLFPGAVTAPLRRLRQRRGLQRIAHLPAAVVAFMLALHTCARAHRTLRDALAGFRPDGKGQTKVGVPQFGAK